MQLILCEKSQPADSLPLVLSQIGFDLDRDFVGLDFATVQKLREELSLVFALRNQFGRESRWIW